MDINRANIIIQMNVSKLLIQWYKLNKRNLPWRETNDSYKIWVSEVILQQTRVAQGLNYYLQFIEKYPNVNTLAESSEKEVLKSWQGLGYYSRARNLHEAAKTIVSLYNGKLPTTYKEIISIKGIGEYTAAAILSIAYNKAYAVVDGNVYRVISRLFAIDTPIDTAAGKKQFSKLAFELLDTLNSGTHNQAIMEFGALHCTPSNPLCASCPLKHVCISKQSNTQMEFPVKSKKTKVKKRHFHYFQIKHNEFTYLNKRLGNDIWKNMYEFPLIETKEKTSLLDLMKTTNFKTVFGETNVTFHSEVKQFKHILTHQHIYANFYVAEATKLNAYFKLKLLRIKANEMSEYPMSRLMHKYLESRNN